MRTTVTLDPDLAATLRRISRERGISFKEALNTFLRAGLGAEARSARPYRIKARYLGVRPGINLDKALSLADEMEDEEIIRKLQLGK